MKKSDLHLLGKRLVCGLLACALVMLPTQLPAQSSAAYAAAETTAASDLVELTLIDDGPISDAVFDGAVTLAQQSYQASTYSSINYGSQIASMDGLTENQRADCQALYDALTTITVDTTKLTVELPSGMTFSDTQEISAYASIICQTAVDAFTRDYPEIFWYDITGSHSGIHIRQSVLTGAYSINSIELTIAVYSVYSPIPAYQAQLEAAISEMEVDTTSRYSAVKSIHDALCERNVYYEGSYAHQAYAGLVDGNSVCEGYAKAFKVMCDAYDIPCVLVSGTATNASNQTENHMWNYVQMEDGVWYGVDVTWDDGANGSIYYDYFLVGSDTVEEKYSGATFGENHVPDGDFNSAGYVAFTYPTLSTTSYLTESEESTAPDETADPEDTAAPGETATPAASESSSQTTEPAETDILYGDVDDNQEVTASDALSVLKAVVGLATLTDTQMEAADVDGDGEVTSSDALYILQRVVNLIDAFPAEQ